MPKNTGGKTGQRAAKPNNIQDLARIAGVSAATVSRALAGTGNISAATRERIRALARELDFRPSNMARSLRTGRTGTVGVIVPLGHEKSQHISDPFFMTLLAFIADRIADRGYDLLLSKVVPHDPEWLSRQVDTGRVDGMIIIGQSNQSDVINSVARFYDPLVVWGAAQPDQIYCSVGSDNRLGGRIATEHLLSLGCRKLAFFGDPSLPEVEQRLNGFRDALRDVDGAVGATLPVHFSPEQALEDISGFLDLADKLDGIFATSDTIAITALQALLDRRRSVPQDVKIIGFDDLDLARRTVPALSSVRQDLEAGADALVDLLFRKIAGETVESVMLQPQLVVRGSTVSE